MKIRAFFAACAMVFFLGCDHAGTYLPPASSPGSTGSPATTPDPNPTATPDGVSHPSQTAAP
jgi:predicted small lipoprotein YifL